MVTYSTTTLEIGEPAPDFSLINPVDHQMVSLTDKRGDKGTLVFWTCNHCPFAVHIENYLKPLADDYQDISFIAINSNSIKSHPQDGPENMKSLVEKKGWSFPFLYDETQEIAKKYGAACTPDFFLFDSDLKLFYRGQMDGSRPRNDVPVTGKDLRGAFDSLLSGNPSPEIQQPSAGCSIKWHP